MIKQPSQHPRWTAPEDMTILPEGFEDNSWGNDSFPHWLNKETNVAIWVDYPQAKSEFGDQEHFFRLYVVFNAMAAPDYDCYNINADYNPCDTWQQVLELVSEHEVAKVERQATTFFAVMTIMEHQRHEHDKDINDVNYMHRRPAQHYIAGKLQ